VDPVDLAETLYRLHQNPPDAEELGRKGKEAVHTYFHADRMARETLAVYECYVS
jgi:hypothetical protein